MAKGAKNPERKIVLRGQGSYKREHPIEFDITHGYLWVGEQLGEGERYLFSLSPAEARKLGALLGDPRADDR